MSSVNLVFNILRYFSFKPESDNQDRGRTRHWQARPDLWQKNQLENLLDLMGANISAVDVIKQSLLINGEWVQPAHQHTVKSRKAVIAPPLMKKEGRPFLLNSGTWGLGIKGIPM